MLIFIFQVSQKRMIRTEIEVFAVQRIDGMLNAVLAFHAANQNEQTVNLHHTLDSLRQRHQNFADAEHVGDLLGQIIQQGLLLLLIMRENRIEGGVDHHVQYQDHNDQCCRDHDQRCRIGNTQFLHQEFLNNYGKIGEDQKTNDHGNQDVIGLCQQNGHLEQLSAVQCIEQKHCIDRTGKHVHRKTREDRQRTQDIAQKYRYDTADNRSQLAECDFVAPAMAPDQRKDLEQHNTYVDQQQVNMPTVVVQELRLSILYHDLRQGNKETCEAVKQKYCQTQAEHDQPCIAAILVQERFQELVVAIGQHQNAKQGYMVPHIDRWPELHTHAHRAAGPADHDDQQDLKGFDDPFFLLGQNKAQQQKQIAED